MLLTYSKNRNGGPLRLLPFICIVHIILGSLTVAQAQLACVQEINISLDNNCSSNITANDLLSDYVPGNPYTVMLTDAHGQTIPGNNLDSSHLWTSVKGKVFLNGNSCWSTINVEDKLAPTITCRDTIINCYETATLLPTVVDGCGSSHAELVNQKITNISCVDTLVREHVFYYSGVDEWGNKSAPCKQTIKYRRIDLNDIVFPPSYELANMTNLICNNVLFDTLGFPSTESAGVPTLNGIPLAEDAELACNISLKKEDFLVSGAGCTQKYMRTWTVYEWYCSTTIDTVHVQTIEISDTEPPVVTPPRDTVVAASSNSGCDALVSIPLPTVTDDCGDIQEIDISYDGGFLNNVTGPQDIMLSAGENIIKYLVYDNCENLVDTFFKVTVVDNSSPTAVCDDKLVVSLRSDGTAKAWSETFDEGSYDNCGSIYKTLIKRLDNSCNTQISEFNDMIYLGHINNNRYYYLSEWKVTGENAIAFSEGFGGAAATFESAAEASWVHTQVADVISDPYYIGLSDAGHDGTFLWPGHVTPTYTNWSAGQPINVGDYVIVNPDGTWSVTNGTARHFYVYESADPFGYSDAVHFCCADAGQEVMVGFRVIDEFGKVSGNCMVTVEVQDKVAPVLSCPSDVSIECGTNIDFNNLQIYGVSSATDVCAVTVDSSYTETINACGVGDIVRFWEASDANGSVSCTQTIMLRATSASTASSIVWPEDYETDSGCGSNLDPSVTGMPDISGAACTDLHIQMPPRDETYRFSNGGDGCLKILREWVVKDLCMEGMAGYKADTFYQAIKVNDFEAPTIELSFRSDCSDVTINTDDCDSTMVNIDIRAFDTCSSSAEVQARLTYDEGVDNNFEEILDFTRNRVQYNRMMPLGVHNVIAEFFDGCGNKTSCTKRIRIVNTAPPTPLCVSGLVVPLQEMDLDGNGSVDTIMAMITAEMLDADNSSLGQSGSFHPCNYNVGLSLSADEDDTERTFSCSDVGTITMGLVVTGPGGIQSVCNTTVEITDQDTLCANFNIISNLNISGNILTEMLEPVEAAEVQLKGSPLDMEYTSQDGDYAFPSMQSGGSYKVSPYKDDHPLNGVSTLDLVMIQNHILGKSILDSPYKLIAADVDNSGNITATDLIELRKVILGINDVFPNNTSWRMVDAAYGFPDPTDPFLFAFPEEYSIQNFNQSMGVDFVGIKTGDVNNTAIANLIDTDIDTRKAEQRSIIINEKVLTSAELETISLDLQNLEGADGIQIALGLMDVEFIDVSSNLSDFSYSNYKYHEKQSILNLSWNGDLLSGNETIEITVRPKGDQLASEVVSLENLLTPEVYVENAELGLVMELGIGSVKESGIQLYQNEPNPWSQYTDIHYNLPYDQDVELVFYNMNGQLLYKEIKAGNKGLNTSRIDYTQINGSGIIYYELITESERLREKMLLIRR